MEDAAARKERLKALRAAAQLAGGGPGEGAAAAADEAPRDEAAAQQAEPEKPVLKFRNYSVKDEKNIQHEKVCSSHGSPPACYGCLCLGEVLYISQVVLVSFCTTGSSSNCCARPGVALLCGCNV